MFSTSHPTPHPPLTSLCVTSSPCSLYTRPHTHTHFTAIALHYHTQHTRLPHHHIPLHRMIATSSSHYQPLTYQYQAMPLGHITHLSATCPNIRYLPYPVTILHTNHSCLHSIHTTHHHPNCATPLPTSFPSTTTARSVYAIRLRQPPSITLVTSPTYIHTQPYLTTTQHASSVVEATMPHTCRYMPRHALPHVSNLFRHPHDPATTTPNTNDDTKHP